MECPVHICSLSLNKPFTLYICLNQSYLSGFFSSCLILSGQTWTESFWPKLINKCVFYLDWDPSNYPLLAKIRQSVERFSSLWHLALDFHENYEKWYYGPFKGLDTNIIQTQVETMYSTACQLSKTFNDSPAARRISETVRTKIEKFRTHLPVLHTLVWILRFKISHNPLKFSFTRETDIKMTRAKSWVICKTSNLER